MKLFKSLCSVLLVCIMLASVGISAFAESADTYSIDLPDGFEQVDSRDGAIVLMKDDIIVTIGVSANSSSQKVNPNDADELYINSFKNQVEQSAKDGADSVEIVRNEAAFIELGDNDAIKCDLECRYYDFKNNFITAYQTCYLFETENYIHVFAVTSDADVTEFADELMKTVEIFDEPIKESGVVADFFGSAWGSICVGAAIGAIVGVVLMFINRKKNGGKSDYSVMMDSIEEIIAQDEAQGDDCPDEQN